LMGTHKQHSQVYRSEIIENIAMLGCPIWWRKSKNL
jgi:hypothetical protein